MHKKCHTHTIEKYMHKWHRWQVFTVILVCKVLFEEHPSAHIISQTLRKYLFYSFKKERLL